ncbi:hypothetical protein [Aurantimicrobium sp. MWH-Uga1]|uniref:hypothetical protein n=1 Tax=Aurantimicrobium sp. MWH-Uga1 TaxID=2079575 RepID=UPI000DEDE881|nr:hypothetical protein [Aurantimicrobium sp. MWH-Uga1]AXE54090.1 hypothetical protein AURUGA1_00383 [Aurantimicrobium sp. MWH-Uga1]
MVALGNPVEAVKERYGGYLATLGITMEPIFTPSEDVSRFGGQVMAWRDGLMMVFSVGYSDTGDFLTFPADMGTATALGVVDILQGTQ